MITIPKLQTAFLDLLHAMKGSDMKLIVGGGFGIYLKVDHVRRQGVRTLLQEWPEPRSTNDIDLFVRPELLIDVAKLEPLAAAISRLDYRVVPGREKYQFSKPGEGGFEAGSIKLDILTGPKERFRGSPAKVDDRRVRPKPSIGVHAHPVEEAVTLEEGLLPVALDGNLSSGEPWRAEVFLPHPYTYLMMKLFAFKDRLEDPDKEYGRYHALDLYSILATTTEMEWRHALEIGARMEEEPYVLEAGRLVLQHFSTREGLGIIRLRESRYYRPSLQLDEFMSAMKELFCRSA